MLLLLLTYISYRESGQNYDNDRAKKKVQNVQIVDEGGSTVHEVGGIKTRNKKQERRERKQQQQQQQQQQSEIPLNLVQTRV